MDKNKVVMIAVGSGIAGLLVGLAASSFDHSERGGYGHGMKHQGDDKGGMMDKRGEYGDFNKPTGMTDMGHSKMDHGGMMVASEREFIMGMIPHHEEAIFTAKQVIELGGSTQEIKSLAENIVKVQEAIRKIKIKTMLLNDQKFKGHLCNLSKN